MHICDILGIYAAQVAKTVEAVGDKFINLH